MYKVKNIKSSELFPAVTELLQNDQKVRITVTGDSMMPFLRENIDSIELSGVTFRELYFGQIPLIKRDNGQYILHRLVWKKRNSFYIAGDAQNWVEGPLRPEQLIAVVTKVWRENRPVSPSSVLWQTMSFFWWLRLPARYILKKPYKLVKKLLKKL
jgi:signal peptidase